MNEKAICRHCYRELIGRNYCYGGDAYIPNRDGSRGRRAPVNYYGGFVCSRECDFRAALALEQSMPGHGYSQKTLNGPAMDRINSSWGDQP